MHITGGCHCGAIKYEADIDPATVALCHCTDCQTMSGSAFRSNVPAKREGFKLTGTPKVYVKTAESGNKRAQAFCPECGTHVYATSVENQQVFGIRAGTCDQRSELRPVRQIWCQSAQPWAMNIDSVTKFPRQPG
jgi:hypothetical protein